MIGWLKRDKFNDFERRLLNNVKRHGCHINCVGGTPSWAYSIGFPQTVAQSDVTCTGAQIDAAKYFINEVLRRCRDEALVLADGLVIRDIMPDCNLIVRAVTDEHLVEDWFNSAIWWQRTTLGMPLTGIWQLVWPSAETGLYPWDKDCGEDFRELQPALYEPRLNS